MRPQFYQCSNALRRLGIDGACKDFVGQQQNFNMAADLRQEASGVRASGIAEKYCLKAQAAADGFFNHAYAFYGQIAFRRSAHPG